MALEHAILVSLAERSASGYDLTRRFDKSIGHFWKASHQQIYKVLGRMETAGLVASTAVPQEGRPDKKVYVITDEGYDALREWSREPSPIEPARSDFAVKVRGLPYGDRDAILADVARRAEAHRERLAYYRADAARTFPDVEALDEGQRAKYAVLRGGILLEESGLAWCEEVLELLGATPWSDGDAGSAAP
ncbi:PadR family transcriptional regulator [Mumia quercus]|uniref:PadR family transcriptional regulator n=1 Tax=Mumia quercus TaxID=2976125 RepID=UPI0021CF5EB2|nr:PadR family transcriptional regulator [Mumia quercus]